MSAKAANLISAYLERHVLECRFRLLHAVLISRRGLDESFEYTHPDPYVVACMPGGTLYMRNPPPPLSVCFLDGNYPADAPKVTFNPDMTICKEETGKSAVGSVLVDFTKKSME